MGGIGIVLMIGSFVYDVFECNNSLVPVVLILCFILGLLGYSFFVSTFFDTGGLDFSFVFLTKIIAFDDDEFYFLILRD